MADTMTDMKPVRRFERFPRRALLIGLALLIVGVIGWILALQQDADRAWRAYLFNWLFFAPVSAGAVMFSAAVIIAYGKWARPVRRISLSVVAFTPVAFVLLFPLLFAAPHILPWVRTGAGVQSSYLNMPFLAARLIGFMALLLVVQLLFAYWALRPDAAILAERGDPLAKTGLYRFLTKGWTRRAYEENRASLRLRKLGPIMGLCYAFAFSFVAFDLVMTLEKGWHSTLIGPYFFMGAFLGGIALTSLLTVLYRRQLGLEDVIESHHLHDLGKLTFAFVVFWGYLFWAQYIVIWYGKLPEEQLFLVYRLSAPFRPLAIAILCGMFIVPFFSLLGVAPKRKPGWLMFVAFLILLTFWFERYFLLYPTYYHGGPVIPFGWQEIATGMAFTGLFILSLAWFASRFPMVEIWEPMWDPQLEMRPDIEVTAT